MTWLAIFLDMVQVVSCPATTRSTSVWSSIKCARTCCRIPDAPSITRCAAWLSDHIVVNIVVIVSFVISDASFSIKRNKITHSDARSTEQVRINSFAGLSINTGVGCSFIKVIY